MMEILQELIKELDERIEKAIEDYYKPIFDQLRIVLQKPAEGKINDKLVIIISVSDLVPTLFLRGQCIGWDKIFEKLEAKHPDVIIKQPNGDEELDELFEDLEQDQKLLLFLRTNSCDNTKIVQIFKQLEDRGNTYLVFYTTTTFDSIYERISRDISIRLCVINKTSFPPPIKFVEYLFNHEIPLGYLPRNHVQFHGKTLAAAKRCFELENCSLKNLRKFLVLALHDYTFKTPVKNIKKFERERVIYSAVLDAFSIVSGEEKFAMNCKIQSDFEDAFKKIYNNAKEKWASWTREKWRTIFKNLHEVFRNGLLPVEIRVNCDKLMQRLEKSSTQTEAENHPPKRTAAEAFASSGTPVFGFRRPQSKSVNFLAEQEQKRATLMNPLPREMRDELIAFLDTIFDKYLRPVPKQQVAGPGDLALLNPSLSSEIDYQLGNLAKEAAETPEGTQLDVPLTYHLLVTHATDFTSIPLETLSTNFQELAKPIEGLEMGARFMAAMAQLEHIGTVKMISEGVVRLIYLPAATTSRDLFTK